MKILINFRGSLKLSRFVGSGFLLFYPMIRYGERKMAGSSFLFLDEKNLKKPAKKYPSLKTEYANLVKI